MTDCRNHPKVLLVEGNTEKRVIPELMEKAMEIEDPDWRWEINGQPVVCIEPSNGIDNILEVRRLGVAVKASNRRALGVLVDADKGAHRQWGRIRNRCLEEFRHSLGETVNLPEEIPQGGLNIPLPNDTCFGVWIMPDNRLEGMLEDFLVRLIPDDAGGLYQHARNCVTGAKQLKAPFKDIHTTKAEIHTWLAWQDEPGKQLHEAVSHQVLDSEMPGSRLFVSWFRTLFKV